MQRIANSMGFVSKQLLTTNAIRQRVIGLMQDAAQKLLPGDIFFVSYSGHGGLLPNLNEDNEPVGFDQTWCLFDAQLVDDELKRLWAIFKNGVRVLVVTDSCFSGTILKLHGSPKQHVKILSPTVLKQTYEINRPFYDTILSRPNVPDNAIRSSVLQIASCRDNQQSLDGPFNSVFTEQLLQVWNEGTFNGSYQQFLDDIARQTPTSQVPQLKVVGVPDHMFLDSKPFSI